MGDARSLELSTVDIESFLAPSGSGVLAVARDDEPYAFPVSYGFDEASHEFYLRLGYDESSTKASFIDEPCPAQLVVYTEDAPADDDVRDLTSVVATGELVRIPKDELDPSDVAQLSNARTPEFELWERAKEDLEFTVNKLIPETLTGRRNVRD